MIAASAFSTKRWVYCTPSPSPLAGWPNSASGPASPRDRAPTGRGLETHRLLARDADGRWRLGPALTELASHVNDPLLAAGAAVLPRLREITGESVQLYRREGQSRVCVVALEPRPGSVTPCRWAPTFR